MTDEELQAAKLVFWGHRQSVYNRKDALGNKILFKLKFREWLDIWIASGHFAERGRGKGKYCMSRYNDIGHYETGNVFIQLHSSNISQAQKGKKKNYPPGKQPRQKHWKRIKTPLGVFISMAHAGKAHGVTGEAIYYRVRARPTEYYYV